MLREADKGLRLCDEREALLEIRKRLQEQPTASSAQVILREGTEPHPTDALAKCACREYMGSGAECYNCNHAWGLHYSGFAGKGCHGMVEPPDAEPRTITIVGGTYQCKHGAFALPCDECEAAFRMLSGEPRERVTDPSNTAYYWPDDDPMMPLVTYRRP